MKIAIRVDASDRIGTGHFMRCLTLADALKRRGGQLRFVSRHLPRHCQDMLDAAGHELALLETRPSGAVLGDLAHADWLSVSQQLDAQDTARVLEGPTWDWIIVDHYGLDARWESAMRRGARKLAVIDDIADRAHACDLLLDQNLHAGPESRYAGKVPAHCRLLLGPRYALLREEFSRMRAQLRPRNGTVRNVLVSFGGVDLANHTASAIAALENIGIEGLRGTVVIGAQHPQREQIESACARLHFDCHVQTRQMAALLAVSDVAVGAGGSAVWERCCLGVPALAISTAANQDDQVAAAATAGLLYALEIRGEPAQAIERHLRALIENAWLRESISRRGSDAVDGDGASRVAAKLGCTGIMMRLATDADSASIFEWRNHPTVRAASRNPEPIGWTAHQQWFTLLAADPNRLLLIGEREGVPVGVVRFDIAGPVAEISIYLAGSPAGTGVGRDLLQGAEGWLMENRPDVHTILAEVLGNNEKSRRLFAGAQYRIESASYCRKLYPQ